MELILDLTGWIRPWDTWYAEPQVDSRDHPIFVREVDLLSEIAVTIVKKSYWVRYPVRTQIKILPWAVLLT